VEIFVKGLELRCVQDLEGGDMGDGSLDHTICKSGACGSRNVSTGELTALSIPPRCL
jgi:hypothetical protein